MARNTLENTLAGIRSAWGPLSTPVAAACQRRLRDLLRAPASEDWLSALHRDAPANRELYRDPEHGFVLLAHTEPAGLYRPPHDHGRAWVIYAIQQGELQIGTYGRTEHGGRVQLVKRNATVLRPGRAEIYLPGDIHDTRCLTGPALLFRFTERDLKKEDKEAHHVTRYVEQGGMWTPGTP
jgi:hypothetical protein